jgi:hypothetical protein
MHVAHAALIGQCVRQLGLYSLASRRFDQPVCLDKIATVG